MSSVEPLPSVPGLQLAQSFEDEKFPQNEKGDHSSTASTDFTPGAVYDDLRDIDMGEDGKERPISSYSSFINHFLLTNILFNATISHRHGCSNPFNFVGRRS